MLQLFFVKIFFYVNWKIMKLIRTLHLLDMKRIVYYLILNQPIYNITSASSSIVLLLKLH